MGWVILFFLGTINLYAEVSRPEPQLVMLPGMGCLLGYAPEAPTVPRVRCWTADADSLSPPEHLEETAPFPVKAPNAIAAAGSTHICVLKKGGVRCFELAYDMEDDKYRWKEASPGIAGEKEVRRMWGSRGWSPELCLERADGSVRCVGDKSWGTFPQSPYYEGWELVREDKYDLVLPKAPTALALANQVGCSLDEKARVHCWAATPGQKNVRQDCARELEASAPKDLRNPGGLMLDASYYLEKNQLPSCRACIQDIDRLRCWGKDFSRDYPAPGLRESPASSATELFPLESPDGGFLSIEAPGRRISVPCVVHAGQMLCPETNDDGAPLRARKYEHPLRAVFFNSLKSENLCLLDEKTVQCNGVRQRHGETINTVGLESVGWSLRRIADHTYRANAELLRAAAEASEKGDEATKLFAINAAAPLLENVASEFFETKVRPAFADLKTIYNRRHGIDGLRSIPGDHRELAVTLLHAAIDGLRGELKTPEPLLAALGEALATHDYERAARAYRTERAQVLAVESSQAHLGLALTADALGLFLGAR